MKRSFSVWCLLDLAFVSEKDEAANRSGIRVYLIYTIFQILKQYVERSEIESIRSSIFVADLSFSIESIRSINFAHV